MDFTKRYAEEARSSLSKYFRVGHDINTMIRVRL